MPRVHCRYPDDAQARCWSRTEHTRENNPANADRQDRANISGNAYDHGVVHPRCTRARLIPHGTSRRLLTRNDTTDPDVELSSLIRRQHDRAKSRESQFIRTHGPKTIRVRSTASRYAGTLRAPNLVGDPAPHRELNRLCRAGSRISA